MAARTPRRTFAAPFVVTLAALPACYRDAQPAPQPPANPPGPAPVTSSPPPTDPTPAPGPANKPNREWRITRGKDSCLAYAGASCPTAAPGQPVPTCNPPPPTKYPCPDGMTDAALIVTQLAGEGDCFILPEMPKCPPNTACNPPPPKKVQCP